jgi:hypothetical protein
MIVFVLKASVQSFASALRKIPGMELVDETELDTDGEDKNSVMFLVVPDARALKEMLSLGKDGSARSRWTPVLRLGVRCSTR